MLAVPDLENSATYFRNVLGFRLDWNDGGDWRLVTRDAVRVMLGSCPADVPPSELGSHNCFGYLEVDDVEGLHNELEGAGRDMHNAQDRASWMRETVATTIDGHRIVFAQELARYRARQRDWRSALRRTRLILIRKPLLTLIPSDNFCESISVS